MWYIIESNKRKTFVLITLMVLLLMALWVVIGICFSSDITFGGFLGIALSIISAIGIIIYVKTNSSKFFLNQVDAVPIENGDYPVLENIVEEMSISANLGFVPKIYIVCSNVPNAFAVGMNEKNSAIAVTTGLLSLLNRDELQGVVAHEISHIKNQDTLYLMYAGVIFGLIVTVSDSLLRGFSRSRSNRGGGPLILILIIFLILSPIMGKLLYFSLSRKREFLADACACQYTRYPTGLASALNKISNYSYVKKEKNDDEDIFDEDICTDEKVNSGKIVSCMYIHNFLQKKTTNALSNLFASHPPISKRIQVLRKMGAADIEEYQKVYTSVVSKKHLIPKNKLSKMDIQHLAIVTPLVEEKVEEQKPQNAPKKEETIRHRQAKDVYYKAKEYKIINCPCETKLKIPKEYKKDSIVCPHCKTIHYL